MQIYQRSWTASYESIRRQILWEMRTSHLPSKVRSNK